MQSGNKFFFFITTNGHSGSRWISYSLNRNPNIFCTHGSVFPNHKFADKKEYSEEDKILLMASEERKNISCEVVIREHFEVANENEYIVGNVHMFNLNQLHDNIKLFNVKKNFKIIDLIRNPIDIIVSGERNFFDQARFNPARVEMLKSVRLRNIELFSEYFKEESIENLSFFASVMVLKSLKLNFDLPVDRRIRFEDLVYYKDSFLELLKFLDPSLIVNEKYLNDIFSQGELNKHAPEKASPESKYLRLKNNQKELINLMLNENGLLDHYKEMDYDLSFIK